MLFAITVEQYSRQSFFCKLETPFTTERPSFLVRVMKFYPCELKKKETILKNEVTIFCHAVMSEEKWSVHVQIKVLLAS